MQTSAIRDRTERSITGPKTSYGSARQRRDNVHDTGFLFPTRSSGVRTHSPGALSQLGRSVLHENWGNRVSSPVVSSAREYVPPSSYGIHPGMFTPVERLTLTNRNHGEERSCSSSNERHVSPRGSRGHNSGQQTPIARERTCPCPSSNRTPRRGACRWAPMQFEASPTVGGVLINAGGPIPVYQAVTNNGGASSGLHEQRGTTQDGERTLIHSLQLSELVASDHHLTTWRRVPSTRERMSLRGLVSSRNTIPPVTIESSSSATGDCVSAGGRLTRDHHQTSRLSGQSRSHHSFLPNRDDTLTDSEMCHVVTSLIAPEVVLSSGPTTNSNNNNNTNNVPNNNNSTPTISYLQARSAMAGSDPHKHVQQHVSVVEERDMQTESTHSSEVSGSDKSVSLNHGENGVGVKARHEQSPGVLAEVTIEGLRQFAGDSGCQSLPLAEFAFRLFCMTTECPICIGKLGSGGGPTPSSCHSSSGSYSIPSSSSSSGSSKTTFSIVGDSWGVLPDVAATPCGHMFCRTCLSDVLELAAVENMAAGSLKLSRRFKCPICRTKLRTYDVKKIVFL